MAYFHREHREWRSVVLVTRSYLHQCRGMVERTLDERVTSRLEGRLARLGLKRPDQVRSSSLFAGDYLHDARRRLGPRIPLRFWRGEMVAAMDAWCALDTAVQDAYARAAEQQRRERTFRLADAVADVQAKLDLQSARNREVQVSSPLHLLSRNKLHAVDFNRIQAIVHTRLCGRFEVGRYMEQVTLPCEPPPDALLAYLYAMPFTPRRPPREKPLPTWVKKVCKYRGDFASSVFIVCDGNACAKSAYLFLMATQKPMEALFCRCVGSNPVFDDPPVWLPRHLRADRSPQDVTFRFWVHPNDVVWDTDISAELEDGLLCLVEDVTFETAHRVSSVWPMVSFEWFSRDMDASAAEPRAGRARRSPHLAGEVEEWETAWFNRVDGVPLREGGGRAAAEEGKGDPATHAIGPLDAEGEAEAWVAVDEARAWVERHAPPDIGEDFFVTVLGGRWTMEHLHMPWDALAAKSRGGLPVHFCTTFRLQRSVRFSRNRYGAEVCLRLCTEWCRRMQYFYTWWVENTDLESDIPEYVATAYDDLEFIEWTLALGAGSEAWPRAMQIRGIAPSLRHR